MEQLRIKNDKSHFESRKAGREIFKNSLNFFRTTMNNIYFLIFFIGLASAFSQQGAAAGGGFPPAGPGGGQYIVDVFATPSPTSGQITITASAQYQDQLGGNTTITVTSSNLVVKKGGSTVHTASSIANPYTFTLPNSGDGAYEITVTPSNTGNESGSVTVTKDATPPSNLAVTGAPSNPGTNSSNTTLSVSATDMKAFKYKLKKNNDAWPSAWSAELTASSFLVYNSNKQEYTQHVKVIARDSIGNWITEANAVTVSYLVDRKAPANNIVPVLTWLDQGLNSGDSQKINVAYSLSSGATKVQVLRNGGTGTDNSPEYSSSGTYQDTGIHDSQLASYYLKFADAVGNVIYSNSASTTIPDRTAPSPFSYSQNIVNNQYQLSITASDGDYYQVSLKENGAEIDKRTNIPIANSYSYNLPFSKFYHSVIRLYDNSGNYVEQTTTAMKNDIYGTMDSLSYFMDQNSNRLLAVHDKVALASFEADYDSKAIHLYDDFENGDSWGHWVDYGNAHSKPYEIITDPADSKNKVMALRNTKGTAWLGKDLNVGEEKSYILRYRVKYNTAAEGYNGAYYHYLGSSNQIGSYYTSSGDLNNSNWQTVELRFTSPKAGASIGNGFVYGGSLVRICLRIHSDQVTNSEILIDDVELIEEQFAYDENGNTTKDLNRGISKIRYNHLNLPVEINKTNGDIIKYRYNAAGQRIEKTKNNVLVSKYIRDSEGNILYELDKDNNVKYSNLLGAGNEVLGQSKTEAVNIDPNSIVSPAAPFHLSKKEDYTIAIKDHLGNARSRVKLRQEDYLDERFTSMNGWTKRYFNTTASIMNNTLEIRSAVVGMPPPPQPGVNYEVNQSAAVYKVFYNYGPENLSLNFSIKSKGNGNGKAIFDFYNSSYHYTANPYANDNPYDNSTALLSSQNFILKENGSVELKDGWRLNNYTVDIPAGTKYMQITLKAHNGNYNESLFFDDFKIRKSKAAERVSTTDYFAFGSTMRHRAYTASNPDLDKWQYQGKERDQETLYDYFEARYYDSALGRFMQADPHGEKYVTMNFYTGMFNNPMRVIDPTGMDGETSDEYIRRKNKERDAAFGWGGSSGFDVLNAESSYGNESESSPDYYLNVVTGRVEHHEGNANRMDEGLIHLAGDNASIGDVLGAIKVKGFEYGYDDQGLVVNTEKARKAYAMMMIFSPENVGMALMMGMPINSSQVGTKGLNLATNGMSKMVGRTLKSVDDVFANPQLLQGKTLDEVKNLLGNSRGWTNDIMRRSSRAEGWVLREMNKTRTNYTGRMIQYHPGTPRHFNGVPYWKVSSGNGTFRIPLK